jgi:hypothetical protein
MTGRPVLRTAGSEHEMRTGTAVLVALLLLLIVVAAGVQLLVLHR